jgi:hypothetical protein
VRRLRFAAEVAEEGAGEFGGEEFVGDREDCVPEGARLEDGHLDGRGGRKDSEGGGALGVGVADTVAVVKQQRGEELNVGLSNSLGFGGKGGAGVGGEELNEGEIEARVGTVLLEDCGDDAGGGVFEGGTEEFGFECGLIVGVALLEDVKEGGAEKSVLVFEAAVDRGWGKLGGFGYARQGAGFEAFRVEDLDGGVEEGEEGFAAAILLGKESFGIHG